MIRIVLLRYVQLGADMRNAETIFEVLKTLADEEDSPKGIVGKRAGIKSVMKLSDQEREEISSTLKHASRLCEELSLPVSAKLIGDAIDDSPETLREYKLLMKSIISEIKSKSFFYIPDYRAKYFDWDGIVSDKVKEKFAGPSAELRNAGTSFAVGLSTASVFHSIRAAEIGVRALALNLNVPFTHPIELTEWAVIQDGIDLKIKEMKQQARTLQRDEDQRFYSEAAAQLRYFKDGWRIRVAHARETFSEQQALTVMEHARAFFETISTRLAEQPVIGVSA
jgi:hypothetical protein